jgi:hypothetical protein
VLVPVVDDHPIVDLDGHFPVDRDLPRSIDNPESAASN